MLVLGCDVCSARQRVRPLTSLFSIQDGATGADWVCTVLHGMDLPCYTHSFYERPKTRSGLRER